MRRRAGIAGNTRTLPFIIPPADACLGGVGAESFASYADRLAAYLEVPLDVLLRRTGIMEESARAIPGGYGVSLTPDRLKRFCYSTGLPEIVVEATLLASYGGVCGDFSAVVSKPSSPGRGTYERAWAYLTGSHACPSCLAESDGVWRLSWKLPWSFACVRHNTLMLDVCPRCDKRHKTGWQPGQSRPAYASRIPEPTSCMNVGVSGSGPCGYPLATAGTRLLTDIPAVPQVQDHLNRMLAGDVPSIKVAGETTAPLMYFDTLRVLASLLFTYGRADDFGATLPFALEAFERVKQESSQRRGSLARFFGTPPESAAALSAVVPVAVGMLNASSFEELSERLRPLVRRAVVEETNATAVLRMLITAAPSFVEAFERAQTEMSSVAETLLSRRTDALSMRVARYRHLSPDDVPQLLWERTYDELFAGFFAPKIRRVARRVCSMSVVRSIGFYSWLEIEKLLELPTDSRDRTPRIMRALQNEGQLDGFARCIKEVVRRLDATPENERINYRQRREALTHLDVVPYDEWTRICGLTSIGAGKDGVLNRCAATWIWCRTAGGDPWLSPSIRVNDNNTIRVHYQRFEKKCTGELERLLTDYGLSLLREVGCR